MRKQYEYDAVIRVLPEKGGTYVVFPWDIREAFGKDRVMVIRELIVKCTAFLRIF